MIYQESYLILVKQPNPWCLTNYTGWEKKKKPGTSRFDGPPGASFHHTKSYKIDVSVCRLNPRGSRRGFSTGQSPSRTLVVFARRRVAPCNGCRWGRSWESQFCLEVFFHWQSSEKKQSFCLGLQGKNCPKITVNKLVLMIQSLS